MSNPSSRRLNYPHAIMIAGLLVALLAVMFRPAGATADTPTWVRVYTTYKTDSKPTKISTGDLSATSITADWDVIPTGKKKPVEATLSGVPLSEFLKAAGANLSGVGFARVRINATNDSRLALVPLGDAALDRPPIILSSGKIGSRSVAKPSLVPGQFKSDEPIREDNIVRFSKSEPYLEVIPAKPDAKLLSIKLKRTKLKSGQYKLSASIKNGSGASAKYQWYQTDDRGNQAPLASGTQSNTVVTTAGGKKQVYVSVVVTEDETGSTGMQSMSYIPEDSSQGSTSNPGSGGGSGGGSGSGSGGGTAYPGGSYGGGGTGTNLGDSGAITASPGVTAPPTPNPQSSPGGALGQRDGSPDGTGTGPNGTGTGTGSGTGTAGAKANDTSVITNVAQNVSGVGGVRFVSGVLLSAPTITPLAMKSRFPLSALPEPGGAGGGGGQLAAVLPPVEDVQDLWPYLVALLFAFSISGAAREWVKP